MHIPLGDYLYRVYTSTRHSRVEDLVYRVIGADPQAEMTPALAWNTAVSFVTNTNWQAYSGESTQGHLVRMAGLTVQNFVSAAVGMAVAVAFVRYRFQA